MFIVFIKNYDYGKGTVPIQFLNKQTNHTCRGRRGNNSRAWALGRVKNPISTNPTA